MSQHIGDMGSVETLAAFERSIRQFADMYQIEPDSGGRRCPPRLPHPQLGRGRSRRPAVGAGPAPPRPHCRGDGRTRGAAGRAGHRLRLRRHRLRDRRRHLGRRSAAGRLRRFGRAAHLGYVPLPGGDATIREPYRAALAHLWAAGIEWRRPAPVRAAPGPSWWPWNASSTRRSCVPTSSMGRLFDAVSSLLGLRHTVSYEAQAAIELEVCRRGVRPRPRYRFAVDDDQIDPGPVLRAIVADLRKAAVGAMAAGFHLAVARADRRAGRAAAGDDRDRPGGAERGVFQNCSCPPCPGRVARRLPGADPSPGSPQ